MDREVPLLGVRLNRTLIISGTTPYMDLQPEAFLEAKGNAWPTSSQILLIRASLAKGETAARWADQWVASLESPVIDMGSYRLLPQLLNALDGHEAPEEIRHSLAFAKQHFWMRHRIMEACAARLLKALKSAGIETMLLKGLALAYTAYSHPSLRPMDDFDILVPSESAPTAIGVFEADGWSALYPEQLAPGELNTRHSQNFRNANEVQADLHWNLLKDNLDARYDTGVWERSKPFQFSGVQTRIVSKIDQAVHLLSMGLRWNRVPPHPLDHRHPPAVSRTGNPHRG